MTIHEDWYATGMTARAIFLLLTLALGFGSTPAQAGDAKDKPPIQAAPANWMGFNVLGGQAVGFTYALRPSQGTGIDVSLGPRFGLSDGLWANLMLTGGGWLVTPRPKVQHGGFARVGLSMPLPNWREGLIAAGYAMRIQSRRQNMLNCIDIGPGYLYVDELPDGYEPFPVLLYLRYSMLFSVGG